jgi:glutamate/tyrosine decarboxylase-like PLP-dependent enzyme
LKTLFEDGQQGQKVSLLAQKRWTTRQQRLSKKLQLVSSVHCQQKVGMKNNSARNRKQVKTGTNDEKECEQVD